MAVPRVALDQWLASGLVLPPGVAPAAAPPVIAGSHDLLLEWAARESGCGLALLNEGSERGLERLAAGEAQIASIHLHGGATADRSANAAAVEAIPGLYDAVVIAFARREQGLIFPFVNPLGLQSLPDAVAKGARFAVRQKGPGRSGSWKCSCPISGRTSAGFPRPDRRPRPGPNSATS